MNRRQFVAAVMAGSAFVPALPGIARTPPADRQVLEVATVGYGAPDDSGIRTISARVSLWTNEGGAAWFQEYLAGEAGSSLPEGEFFQSPLEEWEVPDVPDDLTVTAIEWFTSVGVVGYTTEWVQVTMRRDRKLWDLWISGAEREQVRRYVSDLMAVLAERFPAPCGTLDLEEYLPQPEDVPVGMSVADFEPGAGSDGERWLTIPGVPVIPGTPSATAVDSACVPPE